VVERKLPKLDVVGSIPIARSKLFSVQIVQAVQTVPERKSTALPIGKSKVSFDVLNCLNFLD
jgi:hypothetical protein